jgi:hypothetical protein
MATDPRVPQSVDDSRAPWNAPSVDHLDTRSWNCPTCKTTLEMRISRDDDDTFFIDEDAWYRQDQYGCDHERCSHAAEDVRTGPDGKCYCSGVCYSQAMYNALNPVRQGELKGLYLALSQMKVAMLALDKTMLGWTKTACVTDELISLCNGHSVLVRFMEGAPPDGWPTEQPQWITDAEEQ